MFDPQRWGPFIVVIWLLTLMSAVVAVTLLYGLPKDGQGQLIVGAVITAFAAGYGFYLNTSTGSKAKDATIAQMAANTQTALLSTPPPAPSASSPGAPLAAFLMLAAISLALLISGQPASAASQPKAPERVGLRLNCGWPVPDPGCRAGDLPAPTNSTQFDQVKQLAIDDLTWASQDAAKRPLEAKNHKPCWDAWLSWIKSPDFPTFTPPHLGLASAIQAGFDLSQGPQALIPDEIINGCARTEFDLRIDLLQLMARLGVSPLLPPFKL